MSDGPPGITSRAPAVQPSWRRDSNPQPADYKESAQLPESVQYPVLMRFHARISDVTP
jgi:hypothetical protein